jgi:uridine kinase
LKGGFKAMGEAHTIQREIVAITGGSGSGKSWLANALQEAFGKDACRISLDDFYQDRSHLSPAKRARLNFDHPRAIDWDRFEAALAACAKGFPCQMPSYDFATHARVSQEKPFRPRPLVIVDGLWLLRRPTVRRAFTYKVFVSCPEKLRCERRLSRDVAERGRSRKQIQEQLRQTVFPMHGRFVEGQRRWADLVLESPINQEELSRLIRFLAVRLSGEGREQPWNVQ